MIEAPAPETKSLSPAQSETCAWTASESWNRLWERSPAHLPTLRAEILALYVDQFSHRDHFRALVAREGDRLAAALPLIAKRQWPGLRRFELPANPWISCGDLLVDETAATPDTYRQLAQQIKLLPAPFVSVQWNGGAGQWPALEQSLAAAGCRVFCQQHFDVGIINIDTTWDAYIASWTKNHRKSIRANDRKLKQAGAVSFRRYNRFGDGQIRTLLRTAFEIENRGWKSQAASSVLATPGMFDFFCQVAERLAAADMLEIQFLELDERPIAFEFGHIAKGTYYSHKVSYDPEFARFGPGQLLMYYQLADWFENREVRQIDTMGMISAATAKWCNGQQPRYRYLISTGGFFSNRFLEAYRWFKPLAKRWLTRSPHPPQPA